MRKNLIFLSVLVLGYANVCWMKPNVERKSYNGYKVFEIVPENEEKIKLLRQILAEDDMLDVWLEPTQPGRPVHVMVDPPKILKFLQRLKNSGISYTTHRENVQETLEAMWNQIDDRVARGAAFNINDFNTYADITGWLQSQQSGSPTSQCRPGFTCTLESIGNSFENRPIYSFKIRKTGETNRQVIAIDATIHAREWIATATSLKILDTLISGSTSNAVRLTDLYDWYIIPVLNPDGYVYSWTTDRYWRKNRNPIGSCYGTDLNRNYDNKWGTDGVSFSPCSNTFCGAYPASEPETVVMQNELKRIAPEVKALLTLHSYGRMWMFSWGNTVDHAGQVCERASDHFDMMPVAEAAANAVQNTYGTVWLRGNSCEVIYATSGSSQDYAKGGAGLTFAYTLELRGSDFVIDSSNIEPSYAEVMNGIVAMCDAFQ